MASTVTVVPFTLDESTVRSAIDAHIARLDQRMKEEQDEVSIAGFGFAIDVLIHLEHNLRLCGCPPEAREAKHDQQGH